MWFWKLDDEQRGRLTTRQFIRHHLMRLQMCNDLTHIHHGGKAYLIASAEEVLALRSEG
jgi:hypothetical protein